MSAEVEAKLRGPEAIQLARRALELMEAHHIWPTPLNYEVCINYIADPQSDLSRDFATLLSSGETITDIAIETLAAKHLAKVRLNEQIRDAGDLLGRELELVAKAIKQASRSTAVFGETLEGASKHLGEHTDGATLRLLVDQLSVATRRARSETEALEQRLNESTAEVERLKEHLEQVRRDATTDGLTNLANRKAFDEELERACAEAKDAGTMLTLALLDIDHFKGFNDTWGHQTGDQVLRYVASVIGRVGAPPRFAARYGGEEFAMIFPREDAATVTATLEEIRLEVSSRMLKRRSTNEDLGTITISAGLAELHKDEASHGLMERADSGLYASKRAGRNRVTNAENLSAAA
ncbi:GGDEF domain-containing protein [Caulobacter segnis]|uniref:GGDEF domain-containing protein n=1 Tax=Caulobacter segnis TaxID=88688 RepID=UPI00240FB41B|nr:GGDEF domain-containing protein [Caulobacter segnis]MDG2521780.1 GGDEF domain-containing protein [Caulobacter segnis]